MPWTENMAAILPHAAVIHHFIERRVIPQTDLSRLEHREAREEGSQVRKGRERAGCWEGGGVETEAELDGDD